ncbi:MAG: hypothetical protein AB8B93_08885 [Pseudomonadales bacterium]
MLRSCAALALTARAWLALLLGYAGLVDVAQAAGTQAGRSVTNRAEIVYQIGGSGDLNGASEITTSVDELLDVTVVLADGGAVVVTAPQNAAVLEFVVTNIGNGTESFRLVAEDSLAGDDFDPTLSMLFLEANGVPGLQIGPGGDVEYVAAGNDPVLAADASITVYVTSDIPAGPVQNDLGNVRLRAVATTIVTESGTDNPQQAAFPDPGTSYAAAGDVAQLGGNVSAVVGTAHDSANLLLRATGTYEVNAALVAVSKSVLAVLDPDGGSEVVTGSLVTYQIAVTVSGSGSVEALQVNDPLPALLDYVPGSLRVDNLPPGEEIDDDFLPAGADNTGYDPATRALSANLGTQAGDGAPIAIEFQAIVR